MTRTLATQTRFAAIRARFEAYTPPPGRWAWVYEFLLFGFKQGWACLFGALLLGLLILTHLFYPINAALPRYDVYFPALSDIALGFGYLAATLAALITVVFFRQAR